MLSGHHWEIQKKKTKVSKLQILALVGLAIVSEVWWQVVFFSMFPFNLSLNLFSN